VAAGTCAATPRQVSAASIIMKNFFITWFVIIKVKSIQLIVVANLGIISELRASRFKETAFSA
jgi:hypothetical protein